MAYVADAKGLFGVSMAYVADAKGSWVGHHPDWAKLKALTSVGVSKARLL